MLRERTRRRGETAGEEAHPRAQPTGARRLERKGGGSRVKKLLPLLLGLLLLALLVILLISLLGGDDDNDKSKDKAESRPAPAVQSEPGRLTAGGEAMLPRPTGILSDHVGRSAVGRNLRVHSVNGNEGFFVGSSADLQYIEWGGDVGENEPSRFQPRKGQRVNLTGPVERAGVSEVEKLKLSERDADAVLSQGAFVNAERVTAAK